MSTPENTMNAAEIPVDAENAAENAAEKVKKPRVPKPIVVPAKIQKKLDTLESKVAKYIEDNKALKAQLAGVKSANSRVRRIPKPAAAATE